MRKFRSDRVNLGDMRIAYLLLFAVSLVCMVSGMISGSLRQRLHDSETSGIRTILYECVDSLNTWRTAESAEEEMEAVMHFRGAVKLLPAGVETEPFLRLAEAMQTGTADADAIRSLTNTLSALSAADFPDGKNARAMIRDAVPDMVGIERHGEVEHVGLPSDDTSWFSRKEAERIAVQLFEGSGIRLIPIRSTDGTQWIAENENLRICFSAFDGSPESLVYIRLGAQPRMRCSDDELCERAGRFIGLRLGCGNPSAGKITESRAGFVRISLRCGADSFDAVLDRHGRVWSITKVKR